MGEWRPRGANPEAQTHGAQTYGGATTFGAATTLTAVGISATGAVTATAGTLTLAAGAGIWFDSETMRRPEGEPLSPADRERVVANITRAFAWKDWPLKIDGGMSEDEVFESHPAFETRDYVRRVLLFAEAYRELYP